MQELVFDEAYWEDVSPNLSIFFNLFLAEELVTKIIQKNIAEKPNQQSDVSQDLKLQCVSLPKKRFTKPKKKKRKGKTKAPKVTPVYLCGQCHEKTRMKMKFQASVNIVFIVTSAVNGFIWLALV